MFVCECVSFLTNNSGVYCVVGPAVVDVSKDTAFVVKGQVDQELFNDTAAKNLETSGRLLQILADICKDNAVCSLGRTNRFP